MLFNYFWYHKFRQLVFSKGGILGLAQVPFSVLFFFFGKSSKSLSFPGFFPGFLNTNKILLVKPKSFKPLLCIFVPISLEHGLEYGAFVSSSP
ncbi:hypothetical protein LEP1GSC086_1645 [Leptospira weilii str. LNT 1234]|nr:hypothetical protein LEP1GSC086_1645 [Leptospira weilii str. LNT 1234]